LVEAYISLQRNDEIRDRYWLGGMNGAETAALFSRPHLAAIRGKKTTGETANKRLPIFVRAQLRPLRAARIEISHANFSAAVGNYLMDGLKLARALMQSLSRSL